MWKVQPIKLYQFVLWSLESNVKIGQLHYNIYKYHETTIIENEITNRKIKNNKKKNKNNLSLDKSENILRKFKRSKTCKIRLGYLSFLPALIVLFIL